MIHVHSLTVPANTTVDAPKAEVLKLSACVIQRVAISFPRGCYWLVGARVLMQASQLYPTTPDEWFVAEDFTVQFEDNTVIGEVPYELTLEAYNEDEKYDHTLRFYFDVVEIEPSGLPRGVPTVASGYLV